MYSLGIFTYDLGKVSWEVEDFFRLFAEIRTGNWEKGNTLMDDIQKVIEPDILIISLQNTSLGWSCRYCQKNKRLGFYRVDQYLKADHINIFVLIHDRWEETTENIITSRWETTKKITTSIQNVRMLPGDQDLSSFKDGNLPLIFIYLSLYQLKYQPRHGR